MLISTQFDMYVEGRDLKLDCSLPDFQHTSLPPKDCYIYGEKVYPLFPSELSARPTGILSGTLRQQFIDVFGDP